MATRIGNSLLAILLLSAHALFGQQSGSSQQTPPQQQSSSSNAAPASAPASQDKSNSTQSNKKQATASKGSSSTTSTQTPAANDNAFPEAQSQAAAKPKPATPSQPHAASDDNPFPEAQSAAAAKADDQDATSPVSKQPLKLLPPPGVSSSNANLPAEDLGETTKRHEREDEYTRDLNPAGRVKDDLQVADFYMKNWNYRGAYLRYRDALQFDSSDETALFGVANASCMQNMTDEAFAQSKKYLLQYPAGKYAKDARKMLSDPKKCADNR